MNNGQQLFENLFMRWSNDDLQIAANVRLNAISSVHLNVLVIWRCDGSYFRSNHIFCHEIEQIYTIFDKILIIIYILEFDRLHYSIRF